MVEDCNKAAQWPYFFSFSLETLLQENICFVYGSFFFFFFLLQLLIVLDVLNFMVNL